MSNIPTKPPSTAMESNIQKAKTFVSKNLPTVKWPNLNDPKIQVCIRNYGIAAICLIITSIVVFKALTVPNINKDQFYLYAMFAILPIIAGTFVISPLFSENVTPGAAMLYGSMSFIFIVAIYLFYRILYPNSVGMVSNALFGLFVLGSIVALAIIYKIFIRVIQNLKGWAGFIVHFIFFIPCILIDILEKSFESMRTAPAIITALFITEILILILYFYGPRLLSLAYGQSGKQLLKDPLFLNRQQVIAKSETFLLDPNDSLNPTGIHGPNEENIPTYRKNYSVSMWVYTNPRATNNGAYIKQSNIFKYGYINEPGKPQITYFNAVDPELKTSDNYYVYYTNLSPKNRFTIQLPKQRWNYIVITYNENQVDLFVNGNLEKTATLDSSTIPEYRSTDFMVVGEGDGTVMDGGLYGAIANVNYHTTPMTQMQVTSVYNLNRNKNPPV